MERRKNPTLEDHINNYDNLIRFLESEIDRKSREMEKGVRTLRKTRNAVIKMRKELLKIRVSKKAVKDVLGKRDCPNGLVNRYPISKELAIFLKVDLDTILSRVDITRAICVYSHLKKDEDREEMLKWAYLNPKGERNLQDPTDKRRIKPDKKLADLLKTEEPLNYITLQKLIGIHIINN